MEIMSKTVPYSINLDETEKEQAFMIFKDLGITPTQAVSIFFREVINKHAIPFKIDHIPNKKLSNILNNPDKNRQTFEDTDSLFAYLED